MGFMTQCYPRCFENVHQCTRIPVVKVVGQWVDVQEEKKLSEGFLDPESYKYTKEVPSFNLGIPNFIQVSG